MSITVTHERESSPKSGEDSPLKRARSDSPVDITTAAAVSGLIAKEAVKEVVSLAEQKEKMKRKRKAKRLQRTMGGLYVMRESAIFTYFAHYQHAKTLSGEEREPYQTAAEKWHALYDSATMLRNAVLLDKIDDQVFNAEFEKLKLEQAECRKLIGTNDVAYGIACKSLNATWYAGEKEKVKSMGYDPSMMPDN
jgi:hypothetical protein